MTEYKRKRTVKGGLETKERGQHGALEEQKQKNIKIGQLSGLWAIGIPATGATVSVSLATALPLDTSRFCRRGTNTPTAADFLFLCLCLISFFLKNIAEQQENKNMLTPTQYISLVS